MSLLDQAKKSFNKNKKLLFKTGKLPDLKKYIGKRVTLPGDPPKRVQIEKITGNVWKPQFYEINDGLLIGMLRFHAQMEGDRSITEDQFVAFEEMDLQAEKLTQSPDQFKEEARALADRIMKEAKKNEQKE